jgi:site-specific recombinase XerD
MGNELVPAADSPSKSLETAVQAAADFITASRAKSTLRAYASDWRNFTTWCEGVNLERLPALPGTVAAYLSALATAGAKVKTIERRCTAVRHFHVQAALDNPAAHPGVKATLDGIRRQLGTAPVKKAALTDELLAKALKKIAPDLAGLRDRALLLLGFAGALRRSELVALDVADIARHPKGLVITIRRSKTDQAGAGKIKAVPHGRKLHTVRALQAWLEASKTTEGALFRGVRAQSVKPGRLSDRQVARIVKKRAAAIGLDPALFAGHSLRSGFISSASDHDASIAKIADHAGHAKLDTTRGYMQTADAFKDHPGKGFL